MAGFPCSTLLALYLTAIIILEGAVPSVESKGTQNTTVPDSNVSLAALDETSREHRSGYGQSQNQVKADNRHGCPNCKNKNDAEDDLSEDSEIYKLRIEMIKETILAKLQLDRAPVLKEKPKESKIAELLANLNLIGEDAEENQPRDFEDEYYGRTTKIIVFSEKVKVLPSQSKRNSSGKLIFHFKLDQNTLTNSVPSAFLWLHMRKSNRHELNGKFLHIEALYKKSEKESADMPEIRVIKSRVKKEKKSGSAWIVVDIKDIVKHWFNKTAPQNNATDRAVRTLQISCRDCESDISHLISSRGRLRPLLVVDLQKPKTLNRRKRSLDEDCTETTIRCCRRDLYINFTKIGWDWILYPRGFNARYCSGECLSFANGGYAALLRRLQHRNLYEHLPISMCCTPKKMSNLSILFFNENEDVYQNNIPNMRVDLCGCS